MLLASMVATRGGGESGVGLGGGGERAKGRDRQEQQRSPDVEVAEGAVVVEHRRPGRGGEGGRGHRHHLQGGSSHCSEIRISSLKFVCLSSSLLSPPPLSSSTLLLPGTTPDGHPALICKEVLSAVRSSTSQDKAGVESAARLLGGRVSWHGGMREQGQRAP